MSDVNSWLVAESGRILPDVLHQRTLNVGPWVNLVQKGKWSDEMGEVLSVMTYERSLPATPMAWTPVGFNDGTGNNCVPQAQQVEWGQTLRQFNLEHAALQSPPICVNDLRYPFKRAQQLSACFSALSQQTSWAWEHRHRNEYVRLSQHKIVARSGLPEDDVDFPTQLPTSRFTAGIAARIYQKLIREGAARDGGSVDMVDNRPQFIAIMSSETDTLMLQEDYKIREDFQYSGRVAELLQPFGVSRPYKGFYHLIDDFAPRWNWDSEEGEYVSVPPYVEVETTKGSAWEVNPDYETASFEDTIIFLPTVFRSLVPAPISSPGGQTDFKPQNYQGVWGWRNIAHATDNPDNTWGFFRGIFSAGSEPMFPQYGYVVRHLRPEISLGLVDQYGHTPA